MRERLGGLDGWVVAAWIVTAVLVGSSIARVAPDPFGDSHDGRNGAIWAAQSRALRTDGFIDSRIGARFLGESYANHPPLIVVETAIAESVGGERRWVTRAPAYLGSIAALFLLWRIALALRLERRWAAWGIAVAASSHLFTSYLAMLDTPVTSLPFGLLLLERWLAWTGNEERSLTAGRAWALAALAALSSLAGWQAMFFAGLLGLGSVRGGWRQAGLAILAGAAGGVAVVAAWQLWIYGSFQNLGTQLDNRVALGIAEGFDISWFEAVDQQLSWILTLANPVALVVGSIGLVLLFRDNRRRLIVGGTTVAAVVLYDLLLAGAAAFHDYWSYWLLVPLALGTARAAVFVADRRISFPVAANAFAVVLCLAPLVAFSSSTPRASQEHGQLAVRLIQRAGVPPNRSSAGGYWAWYEHDRSLAVDGSCDEGPNCIVLVYLPRLEADGYDTGRLDTLDVEFPYALTTASAITAMGEPSAVTDAG